MYIKYFGYKTDYAISQFDGTLQDWVMDCIGDYYDLFGEDVDINLDLLYANFEIRFGDDVYSVIDSKDDMFKNIITFCFARYQREHQLLKDVSIKEDAPSVTIKADNVGFTVHETAYTQREVFDLVNRLRKDGCTNIRFNFGDCDRLPK